MPQYGISIQNPFPVTEQIYNIRKTLFSLFKIPFEENENLFLNFHISYNYKILLEFQ